MSIWSTLVGGAAGLAMGGPIGAILGAMAGHYVGKKTGGTLGGEATEKATFTIGVIVLSAKMAKADGHVSRDEVNVFKQAFRVPASEARTVGRIFDQAKGDATGYEPYARQLAALFCNRPAVLEELLSILFYIANADGVIHPAEKTFLEDVALIFNFTPHTFERIREEVLGSEKSDPYTILGATADMSDKEVKGLYRKLIKEHHPDKLIAEGVPEEFIKVATEKLALINAAYDRIAKMRGMN